MRTANESNLLESDVLVASYPRSGSTWTRKLLGDIILQLHNIDTSNCSAWFEDKIIPDIYRDDLSQTDPCIHLPYRLIMTHEKFNALIHKTIYIFRKAADALCSYYHYHIDFLKTFNPQGLDDFCLKRLTEWCDHVSSYLKAAETKEHSIFFLSFEWLKRDAVNALLLLTDFLGLPANPRMCEIAVNNHTFQKCRRASREFFRKGAIGSSLQELNAKTIRMINTEANPLYNQASRLQSFQDKNLQGIVANEDLSTIKSVAQKTRFGNWQIRFRGLKIRCRDLLSFYMAAKDIFLNGIYAFETSNPSPVIIDGGAHIGLFTLYAKQKYPNAEITLFEPDEKSLGLLKQNLADNHIRDVKIVQAGLFSRECRMPFGSDSSDGSSIFAQEKNTFISTVPLSKYIQSEIDFLKLNIEGAELDVLLEIEPKLRFVREIVIEYHGFPEIGQNLHKILAILDRAGFRYMIHDFDGETNPASKPPFVLCQTTRFYLLIYARKNPSCLRLPSDTINRSGDNTHLQPVSRLFGLDRGTPIDRYYIERFLERNKTSITGWTLEIGDSAYTKKFGTGVVRIDVLDVMDSPNATILGDLSRGQSIPNATFDCIIMTQTIQVIYDLRSAIQNVFRALKPGGTLLLTASGISQISRYDMDRWGEYWRFTNLSLKKLLEDFFGSENVEVKNYGNYGLAVEFLNGRAAEELTPEYFEYVDDDYQVLLTAKAIRPATENRTPIMNLTGREENFKAE
jgi:FkbM family methyltransferase